MVTWDLSHVERYTHLTHRVTTCPQTLCWDVTRLLGPRHPAERVRGTPVCLRGDGVLCKSVHLSSVKSPWLSGERPEGFRMSNSAKLVTFKHVRFLIERKQKGIQGLGSSGSEIQQEQLALFLVDFCFR